VQLHERYALVQGGGGMVYKISDTAYKVDDVVRKGRLGAGSIKSASTTQKKYSAERQKLSRRHLLHNCVHHLPHPL
jgi:hypothetical protein